MEAKKSNQIDWVEITALLAGQYSLLCDNIKEAAAILIYFAQSDRINVREVVRRENRGVVLCAWKINPS